MKAERPGEGEFETCADVRVFTRNESAQFDGSVRVVEERPNETTEGVYQVERLDKCRRDHG